MIRLQHLVVIAGVCLCSLPAVAQNTMFMRESPIAHLNDEDKRLLRETIEEVLDSPDGTVLDWANEATGSFGRVKVLDTTEDAEAELECRNIRARNESRGRKADGIYRLCREDGGDWRFAAVDRAQLGNAASKD